MIETKVNCIVFDEFGIGSYIRYVCIYRLVFVNRTHGIIRKKYDVEFQNTTFDVKKYLHHMVKMQ